MYTLINSCNIEKYLWKSSVRANTGDVEACKTGKRGNVLV